MGIQLKDLLERLGGELTGDAHITVEAIAPLSEARPSHITFLSNPKFRETAAATQAAALILSRADNEAITTYRGARIVTDNPYAYFARTAQWFVELNTTPPVAGIAATAHIDPSARIAASASIGPFVVVEADVVIEDNVVIGAGCHIGRAARIGAFTRFYPRVTFLDRCEIGQRGILHSGAVIGADGFGFANDGGNWVKIPQTGRVIMGDDVEIGANTTVDRGALADTVLENDVKLDNQIQIAHNCKIGAHTAIAACTGIAGSATIGKYCTIGGGVRIQGHAVIADHVHISACSIALHSIPEAGHYTGFYPIAKHREWEKSAALVRNLSGMRDKLRALEKTVRHLTEKTNPTKS